MNWEKSRHVLRPLFFISGILFLAVLLVTNWNESKLLLEKVDWLFFSGSIVLAILDNIVISIVFFYLLRKYRLAASYPIAGEMFFLGQLAKYIPGRFWGVVYQATYFNQPSASVAIFFANLDLTALCIVRGLIIGALLILFTYSTWSAFAVILTGAFVFVWLLKVEWVSELLKRLKPKKYTQSNDLTVQQMDTFHGVLAYGMTILLYLLANYMLLVFGFHIGWSEATLFIAFFSISWVAGVIAFVMPAGVGVRELVFVFLGMQLNDGPSIETLATIAIIYRFWQIFHELGSIAIGLSLRRFSH